MYTHDKTQWLLFDLGNVLVELDGFPWFEMEAPGLDLQSIHQKWLALESVRAFETGKITEDEFFNGIVRELGNDIQVNDFRRRYREWVRGFYPGAGKLLSNLASDYRLACLSNTNSFHIRHLRNQCNTLDLFERKFLSHEIAAIKPDIDAFQHVINQLAVEPSRIFFMDDNLDNVNTARRLGIKAEQVIGFEHLEKVINKHLTSFSP